MKGVVRSPRSSVTPADHPALDSLLKDLRTCHRRLTNATKAQHEELRILERLYYKSNNQHRSSMLWKKMVEMRRIGGRLIEVNLPGIVETLRRGFYSEEVISATSGNKALKGPWTHVPDLQYLSQIAKRAEQIHVLLRKAEDVYLKCYDAFALSLQDTSFIVLSVTLMAITARLNHLVQECREALYSLSAAISGLKGILYPSTPKAQLTLENVELVESARKKSDGMYYESDLGTVVERATFHEAPTMPALAVSGLDDLMTFDDDMVQDLQRYGE
ncbi:hypothetical protein FRC02_001283 [Tulasnella sp. 418]|nr:hypothetical protein FRC02_001283 [Tulasnella sp. 418]